METYGLVVQPFTTLFVRPGPGSPAVQQWVAEGGGGREAGWLAAGPSDSWPTEEVDSSGQPFSNAAATAHMAWSKLYAWVDSFTYKRLS